MAISGFPEFLPGEQITFNQVIDVIKKGFERAGAVPIETPAVERIETLSTAKGNISKEVYGLRRLKAEEGDDATDLALHFDLTVPLARYVAEHANDLAFPFRRYQIQPVWRGERAQAGRYRQFYQCDIDVIGEEKLSLLNDAEMPFIIYQIFKELNIGHFQIRINNRKILQGFLTHVGVDETEVSTVIGIVDALEKVGVAQVTEDLTKADLNATAIESILEFFSKKASSDELVDYLKFLNIEGEFATGLNELITVLEGIGNLGVPSDYYGIDLSMVRGLDYYTGTIYETRLTGHAGIGSICSGGRYDNLAANFASKKYPGVGISIGLTRLLPKLFELGIIQPSKPTVASVLVMSLETDRQQDYLRIGGLLRNAGINTEVYLEDKKLAAQMKYANKKGIPFVMIIGQEEFENNTALIRNMEDGEQQRIQVEHLVSTLKALVLMN
ncbi:histidine--tRNA ligase [Spirulina sp. CCNP1310]|uniref:histidine--tRNA ligase n=1 Tax=Spirulina sp. CCNP1310 TaxID=3110249 RepID=UPI002B1EB4F5|nr:histidine--tRNA ligase [Spirulina sp. CCNP1310]MEA5419831.1 histidine--tRNA ligase [Spirulina sp. CCNP1310]